MPVSDQGVNLTNIASDADPLEAAKRVVKQAEDQGNWNTVVKEEENRLKKELLEAGV